MRRSRLRRGVDRDSRARGRRWPGAGRPPLGPGAHDWWVHVPLLGALVRFLGARTRWLVGVTLLTVLLALLGLVGWGATIEDTAANALNPVQRVFRQAGEPISNLLNDLDNFGRLDSENRALRSRVEQLEAENARLREEQIQVRARQALLEVQAETDAVTLTAYVTTRDLTGLRTIIGIDRGSNDGLRVGLPVLAGGGTLIGQVIEVRPHTAFVRLITDPDSAIRVFHQPSRSEVVATGDTLGNLEVRIPWTSEVELGHIFVTSGLDGEFPQGLPVGRVSATEGTVQDAFRHVVLEPIAPLGQLEQVLIQLTIPPPELDILEPEVSAAGGG
ncbi:MAG: rod shape-determining protein MreC [Chloroflexi bacterium]|nr:rod shape-determining protein MreC [Chloroflexota bacterium]MYF23196.1 rod shape-determining protein MreC [Chloroflexota bacterium]